MYLAVFHCFNQNSQPRGLPESARRAAFPRSRPENNRAAAIVIFLCVVPYIESKIAEGEHQQQDFKYAVNDARKLAATLSAFANTDGGTLLIGVRDNGSVAGVRPEEEVHMLEAAASVYCSPAVALTTQVWRTDNRYVLEARVAASPLRPHYVRLVSGEQKAYIRVHDQNLPAPAVLIEVWKGEISERPQKYFHTDKEKKIFEVLEHQETGLTLSALCRQTGIPRKILLPLVARLIRWKLLDMGFMQDVAVFRLVR